jgi:hypothetical protein
MPLFIQILIEWLPCLLIFSFQFAKHIIAQNEYYEWENKNHSKCNYLLMHFEIMVLLKIHTYIFDNNIMGNCTFFICGTKHFATFNKFKGHKHTCWCNIFNLHNYFE